MIRKWHGLVLVFAVGGTAALTSAVACGPGSGGGGGGNDASTATPGPAAVYVVDATGTLFAFDAQGNQVATASLPGPVNATNGGGLTMGPYPTSTGSALYATNGSSTAPVTIYSTDTLTPQVPQGNLGPPFAPLTGAMGIVFDSDDDDFYIANSGGICAWQLGSLTGATALQAPPTSEPNCTTPGVNPISTSLAYSPQIIWSVQPGAQGPLQGPFSRSDLDLEQYGTQSPAQQPIVNNGAQTMSVAICTAAATGASADIEVVGYSSPGQVVAFLAAVGGGQLGSCNVPSLTGPYAMSCNSQGVLFVADASGLYSGTVTSAGIVTLGLVGDSSHFVVTPPVYGVYAADNAIGPSGSSCSTGSDAGGGDGGCTGLCIPDTPIPDDIDGGVMAFCQGLNTVPFVDSPDGGRNDDNITAGGPWCSYPNPTTDGGWVCCESGLGPGAGSFGSGTFTQCVDHNLQVVAAYSNPTTPYPTSGGPCLGPTPSGANLVNCSTTPPGYLVTDFSTEPDCNGPGGTCVPWCACQQQCTP